jgi:hypothetical protein
LSSSPPPRDRRASRYTARGGDIFGESMSDFAGWAVSLSSDGHYVAVGSPKNDDGGANAGHARVFYAEAAPKPTPAPTATPTAAPTSTPTMEPLCDDAATKKWTKKGESCADNVKWIKKNKKDVCKSNDDWIDKKTCQQTCWDMGKKFAYFAASYMIEGS